MMSRRHGTAGRWRVAVVALVSGLLLSGCSLSLSALPGPAPVSGSTYQLSADFGDVLSLTTGAFVKIEGVVVGAVSTISESNFVAHVGFKIKGGTKLPVGTTAQIRFTTPLGDDYVALTLPSDATGKYLAAGAHLSEQSTTSAPTIEDAFAAMSLLLNGGGLEQIKTIATQLDTALNGRSGEIRSVLANLDTIVSSLDAHKNDIDTALVNLDKLATTLNSDNATIEQTLQVFPTTLTILAQDTTSIQSLLTKVGTLGTATSTMLARSQSALLADIADVEPVLQALVSSQNTLVPTMKSLITFGSLLDKATPGDYLNASVNVIFDLNAKTAVVPTAGQYTHSDSDTFSQLVLGPNR